MIKNRRRLLGFFIVCFCMVVMQVSASLTPTTHTYYSTTEEFFNSSYDDQPYPGYTLFSPEYGKNTYLINTDGEIVHMWGSTNIQGLATYLLEDGSLLRACSPYLNPIFAFGGFTGKVEQYDWAGNLVWEYQYINNTVCLHHDVCVLPNGNILMIAWEYKSYDEVIAAGRNPEITPWKYMCFDHIIEVKPTGSDSGEIVWEWHIWDHLIQEYNHTNENYGIVKDHPELIDMNYQITDSFRNPDVWNEDYFHVNAIDYNEALDQILISVRNYNEIWVIDHSTTTKEAAEHTGGRYGKGGDLLYRWGNPETYQRGTVEDKQLFFQHDAQWIDASLPGEGNILIFNNGVNRPDGVYSSVDEIIPPLNEDYEYVLSDEETYGPDAPVWQYTDQKKTHFFSIHLSSAQRLPNGNTLICDGYHGYFFEVNSEKDVVWEYQNIYPYAFRKDVFKARKYPLNYSGLGDFENIAPSIPEIIMEDSSVNSNMASDFTISAYDPNGDDVFYTIDWDDHSDQIWIGPFTSGREITVNHSWDHPGIYQIRVRCKDSTGLLSDWSEANYVLVKPFQAWLYGTVDAIREESNGFTIVTDSVYLMSLNPLNLIRFSEGTDIFIGDEYRGILKNRFIFGKYTIKEI